MFLMIDNYDSFVYNLVRYLKELKVEVMVVRNDAITLEMIESLRPEGIVISPGPKRPTDAGISEAIVERFAGEIPILGICLGHQVIGHVFGARVIKGLHPVHGKVDPCHHQEAGIFKDIPSPFDVTRYHSLIVDEDSLPTSLVVTAKTEDGVIMGLEHRKYPVFGVQFHPEAALTQEGHALLMNFIRKCREIHGVLS